MKWPHRLTMIRHGESAYNELSKIKKDNEDYQEFKEAFEDQKRNPERVLKLAHHLMQMGIFDLGTGNHDTVLTNRGYEQAHATGILLPTVIEKPDIVMISPYLRTWGTYEGLCEGWPELADVETVEDERWREQEHGLAEVYADWRIFHTVHPEQAKLYARQGPYWYRYPQGENVPDVRGRVRSGMTTISREYPEKNVLIIGHHLTKLSLRAHLERLTAEQFINLDENEKPVNCGVTSYQGHPELGRDGKLLLDQYNQQLWPAAA